MEETSTFACVSIFIISRLGSFVNIISIQEDEFGIK